MTEHPRISTGHNRTGHKLETSEVLYENSIFANIGSQDAVAFNCTKNGNCGGVVITNFNDYDNTFDGCSFFNNSWGIYTATMANVYVRNSRFERNGFHYAIRTGPAIATYEGADIALAKSAGSSVRRCVSVNSTAFVVSPGSETSSPTTIEGNVIDSWRGFAAIKTELRGPYLFLDNAFTNGSHDVVAADPYCQAYQPFCYWHDNQCWQNSKFTVPSATHGCGHPINIGAWSTTNAVALVSGNTINGKAVTSAELFPCFANEKGKRQKQPACSTHANVKTIDLQSTSGAAAPPRSGLSAASRFLKSSWPVPTSLVDARDHGCTGTEKDSTICAQATIDAAAKAGQGAAAYFAPRTYKISAPLRVKPGNYSVVGTGIKTVFSWSNPEQPDPTPAVMVVERGGGGLRLEQFMVVSGASIAKGTGFTPTILHDGAATDATDPTDAHGDDQGRPSRTGRTVYDGIYTSVGAGGCGWHNGCWNATGFVVKGLKQGDTAHFVHLDGNLKVQDSAAGTVFLGFMIQGSLNVSGAVQPAPDRTYPSVGAATVVGLTDRDINVNDDQSVAITDYYSEQIKTGHLYLGGSGKAGRAPGRVTISAVKSMCYTSNEITVDNYHGSLVYASSLFFEGPNVSITQTGVAAVNITMLGNGFNGSSPDQAVRWVLGPGAKGRNSAIGNTVPCMNCRPTASLPVAGLAKMVYPETQVAAEHGGAATTNGTIAAAIDDWRRLGLLDLLLNHPGAADSPDDTGARAMVVPPMKTDDDADPAAAPALPTLTQIPRSDWLSVKDGCNGGPEAKGDGKADDTEALQACFSSIGNMSKTHTIYLPTGKYIVKQTLVLFKVLGGTVVGDGEGTVLVWHGQKGGNSTLILSDGISRSRLIGFVLDGSAGCDVGIEHHSQLTKSGNGKPVESLFETRIRHQNQKFLGFGQAGIRIGDGGNQPGRKESAEIIYENNIFWRNGLACKGLPYPPMTATGCGGVAILNFNDYDNVFDGNTFVGNSFGLYNDKMANVYVRNCNFEKSTMADVYLAASAGNSVRRSTSSGSSQFIAAPARSPGASNPTVIHDNRIDGWTSSAGAIAYGLRGPVFVYDNQFTNGPAGPPIQPMPPASSNYTYWILANNQLDGKPAGAATLVKAPANVKVYDIDALAPSTPSVPASPLSTKTVYLKLQWPTPTKIFDVTTFGANGSHAGDDTMGIQAAINAAAKAGGGAMCYLPAGQYRINKTLEITGSDFWVGGSGLQTSITYSCPVAVSADEQGVTLCPEAGPALRVSAASNVSIEMMQIKAPSFTDQLLIQGGTGIHGVKLDGIYCVNSALNTERWNGTTAIHIAALAQGETVHAIHLDGNLNVSDSGAGTVLVGMIIQSTVHVNGASKSSAVAAAREPSDGPALGFLTFIGLVDDYDVVVQVRPCQREAPH
jgi:hypothetical protein